jgi:hypothetical protein
MVYLVELRRWLGPDAVDLQRALSRLGGVRVRGAGGRYALVEAAGPAALAALQEAVSAYCHISPAAMPSRSPA